MISNSTERLDIELATFDAPVCHGIQIKVEPLIPPGDQCGVIQW